MQRGLRITLAVAAAAGAVALSAGTAFADDVPAVPSADSIGAPADSAPALPEAGSLPSADSLSAVEAPKVGDSLPALGK